MSQSVAPGDPRYDAVIEKRFNKRFSAHPDYITIAESTADVVAAVERAVHEGRRLTVTSGGHCLEGFVSDPDVRVLVDTSSMKQIYHDPAQRAIAVEAGATVGEALKSSRWMPTGTPTPRWPRAIRRTRITISGGRTRAAVEGAIRSDGAPGQA